MGGLDAVDLNVVFRVLTVTQRECQNFVLIEGKLFCPMMKRVTSTERVVREAENTQDAILLP